MQKNYDHNGAEDNLYADWQASGKMRADATSAKPPFTIPLPPPNVTGQLHLGHAAMLAIEDILIRYKRMTGHEVCWLPGTDHAAIATENVVIKHLGIKSREELSRDDFLTECRKFSAEKHDRIVQQMKKMGAWLDWSRESYTLDEPRSNAVTSMFKMLYEDGLIERGHRMINWSVGAQSVLSDDEVEWETAEDTFYHIKCGPFIVGTVRPETKCADSPVMIHPEGPYVILRERATNEELIIAESLWKKSHAKDGQAAEKDGDIYSLQGNYSLEKTVRGSDLIGRKFTYQTYAGERHFWVVADEYIDPDFGTGAMTISPSHDANDFMLAEKHDFALTQKITFEGKMTAVAGPCEGLSVEAARKKSAEIMRTSGLLFHEEPYSHQVPKCYRSNCVVEPMLSPQWFVLVEKEFIDRHTGETTTLKKLMQSAVRDEHVKIIPERFNKTYFQWIDNLRDWCISRQIWWGHRIPVWYDDQDNIHLPEEKTVILARHGESEESAIENFIDTQTAKLSKTGKDQARTMVEKFRGENITKIITSGSARAKETAEIIAAELGLEIEVWDEFSALDFGKFHGMKRSDVCDEAEKTILEVCEESGEGENRHQAFARIKSGWEKLKSIQTEGNILVVSHRTVFSGIDGFLAGKDADSIIANRRKNSDRPHDIWGEYQIFAQPKNSAENLRQDNDTLDTWFSSALWPISPLGWPNENHEDFQKFYPSDVLETGHDILFFWVARMIMFGRYATGKYPFHTVYLHGLVCDEHGKKMSKSKGNGIDPLEVIEEVGADAVRMSLVVGSSPGNNIPIGKNKIKGFRNFVNKLWNAGRFVQMQRENSAENLLPPPPLIEGGSSAKRDGGSGLFSSERRLPYNLKLTERARELRKNMTEPEKKFWYEILQPIMKEDNSRWLKQRPIDNYIIDFYCPKLKLVVEIDGDSHANEDGKVYDEERTKILESHGLTVIRYWNNEVMENPEGVFADLTEKIANTQVSEKREFSLAERWILSRFSKISAEISAHLQAFEISAAGDKIYHFVWDEFCAWFLEAQKVSPNPAFLAGLFAEILKLVHPLCPYVTESIWKEISAEKNEDLVIDQDYPQIRFNDEPAVAEFEMVQTIVTDIRRIRTEQKLNPKEKIRGIFGGTLSEESRQLLVSLAGLSELTVMKKIDKKPDHSVTLAGTDYELAIEIPFDAEADAERIAKERADLEKKIANLEGRLSNKKYVDNAPEKLVTETKAQLEAAKQLLKKLK